jgi:NDP-sugar pyrophosphorylase family protein
MSTHEENPVTAKALGYQIKRHSGRVGGEWRDVPTPKTFDAAQRKYLRMKAQMRQGGVELWNHGKLVQQSWAPQRRTQ